MTKTLNQIGTETREELRLKAEGLQTELNRLESEGKKVSKVYLIAQGALTDIYDKLFTLNQLEKISLKPGQNWTGQKIKGQCTDCMEYKPLEYVFLLSTGKVLTAECIDCMAKHF